jgi:hypothetical protein
MRGKWGSMVICLNTDLRCWVWKQEEIENTIQDRAKKIDGSIAEFRPYGVDKITGDEVSIDFLKAKNTF